jgi:basic amino acid/polyamine antiporter, APA family
VRVAAGAAVASLFVQYLGAFWSRADDPVVRALLLTLLVGALTAVNYCGVELGARVSDLLAILKLLPLALFCVVGVFFVQTANLRVGVPAGHGEWTQAVLLLVFAYGGFESAVIPAAEFRDPAHDPPFALGVALTTAVVLHSVVQTVVVGTLPLDAVTDRPLVAAAARFLGRPGALILTLGALVSIYGALTSSMLNTPRLTFALAQRGDFPAIFAAVHPRFRTPYVSILVYGAFTWVLAVWGGFSWNANLSAVARLLVYVSICVALLVFRRRHVEPPPFQLPFPRSCSIVGTAFCVWLALRMSLADAAVLGIIALLATTTWAAVRRSAELDR